MSHDKPYTFGDVVDGHRWTIAGWERVAATEPVTTLTTTREPEPVAVLAAPTPVRMLTHDDTPPWVAFELGDVAEGQRLAATGWEPIEPAAAVPSQRGLDGLEEEHRQVLAAAAPVVATCSPEPAAGWYPRRARELRP